MQNSCLVHTIKLRFVLITLLHPFSCVKMSS